MSRTRVEGRTSELTLEMKALHALVRAPYRCLARRTVEHAERIPAEGACLIVANHVTEIDPVTVGLTVVDAGRVPRFLAKESLFRIPVLGHLLRRIGQVPVHRGTRDSVRALGTARERLAEGGAVVIYPEGTLTRDPERWPMHSYPGAARLALGLGIPVIPVAHWGDQEILGRDRDWRPHASLWPPKRVRVRVGEPVDLSRFDHPDTRTPSAEGDRPGVLGRDARVAAVPHAAAAAATEAILDAISAELSVLRGEPAPETRWDTRIEGRR
ncbi:1-acyl-sn-glycerol-3-phosphate acyltransferase [Kocuria palustris]|uniref:lysophospholipid acyltransferase family protein n=1 Tax=Kocuria palustris TaxID=71999 RepID=UPI0021B30FE2|nr:lysophospholipid acyltransferase family protein [Kocuria palustris]